VDVIGHDDPRPQIVFLPNAPAQQQSFGHTGGNPRFLEPSGTRVGNIQSAILSREALPIGEQAISLLHISCPARQRSK